MNIHGSDQYVGIVENGKFQILMPESDCAHVRLTGIGKVQAMSPEAREIDLTAYEGKAIVVQGYYGSDWIWKANIIEQAGLILSDVLQQVIGQTCVSK